MKLNSSDSDHAMSARLGVDFLLLEARELVTGSSPPRSYLEPLLQIVPDVELTVKVCDMLTGDNVVVTAHADWVAGYPAASGIAVTFLALHAKTPAEFSGLYVQLVTALGKPPGPQRGVLYSLTISAIARERWMDKWMARQRWTEQCPVVQGFVTDGVLYRFVKIDNAGEVCSTDFQA